MSESVPAGWNLTSATCDDGSAPASIGLAPSETVTCTFENTEECTAGVDSDGDTFNDEVEWYLPTDCLDDCPDVVGSHDAWPIDMNMDRLINLGGDVVKYVGKMGCVVAIDPSCRRLDLNMDGLINLGGDVVKYVGKMGGSCA